MNTYVKVEDLRGGELIDAEPILRGLLNEPEVDSDGHDSLVIMLMMAEYAYFQVGSVEIDPVDQNIIVLETSDGDFGIARGKLVAVAPSDIE